MLITIGAERVNDSPVITTPSSGWDTSLLQDYTSILLNFPDSLPVNIHLPGRSETMQKVKFLI